MQYKPKYDVGPFVAPRQRLYAKPTKRITPKSAFLLHVEGVQKSKKKLAKIGSKLAEAAQRAADAATTIAQAKAVLSAPTDGSAHANANRSRRVVQLVTGYTRRRTKVE